MSVADAVVALRAAAVLGFAALMLIRVERRDRTAGPRPSRERRGRLPVVANFAAFAVFATCLSIFATRSDALLAIPMAMAGCILAVGGACLVVRARAELGAAWSLAPKAEHDAGLVTTGPYRRVRHPIYLGLIVLAIGQALAFASWPALVIVLAGIVPTFVWRARVEETVLARAFGERYEYYRQGTGMIIPRGRRAAGSRPPNSGAAEPERR